MEKCPRCGAAAIAVEEVHCECGACGFYYNPHIFNPFIRKNTFPPEPYHDEHEDVALPPIGED